MTLNVELVLGDPEVDTWAVVTDPADLRHYPALNSIPVEELFAAGKLFTWEVEMDTKYAVSEAISRPNEGGALFFMPDDTWLPDDSFFTPTEFVVTLPDGDWTTIVLGGRYDHLVLVIPARAA